MNRWRAGTVSRGMGCDIHLAVQARDPNESPPLGKGWTVYGPMTAKLRAMAGDMSTGPVRRRTMYKPKEP